MDTPHLRLVRDEPELIGREQSLDDLYAWLLREQPHNTFLRERIAERQGGQRREREPGEEG